MGRIRIIFQLYDAGLSGGNRYIYELANRLYARGYDVEIYAVKGSPGWFPLRVHFSRGVADRADVVVATYWRTAEIIEKIDAGHKIYLVQNYEPWFPGQPMHRVEDTYRLGYHIIVVSEWLYNLLKRRFGVEPIGIVPGGVDRNIFRPSEKASEPTVMCLDRRHDPRRGMDILFGAMDLLGEGVELILASGVSDEELAGMYGRSWVYVNTSLFEGCALPPLEAMACATPVVSTPVGVEYLEDGWNGLIVPPNPRSVCDALKRILCDRGLRSRLGFNAWLTSRRYTWERTAEGFIECLEKIS